ncbi:hypothetical protein DFH08DRAFT_863169 [Mycena albidolilacea]|uniref:Uncharacterized protein n=1 Tax=Mycena albidolilacea TaxID=1033008 RepID=A0AAD7A5C0_9AGAR|nr:hypothetical protein DFH08DRAFT_863169 [Mycena albidolilacea]
MGYESRPWGQPQPLRRRQKASHPLRDVVRISQVGWLQSAEPDGSDFPPVRAAPSSDLWGREATVRAARPGGARPASSIISAAGRLQSAEPDEEDIPPVPWRAPTRRSGNGGSSIRENPTPESSSGNEHDDAGSSVEVIGQTQTGARTQRWLERGIEDFSIRAGPDSASSGGNEHSNAGSRADIIGQPQTDTHTHSWLDISPSEVIGGIGGSGGASFVPKAGNDGGEPGTDDDDAHASRQRQEMDPMPLAISPVGKDFRAVGGNGTFPFTSVVDNERDNARSSADSSTRLQTHSRPDLPPTKLVVGLDSSGELSFFSVGNRDHREPGRNENSVRGVRQGSALAWRGNRGNDTTLFPPTRDNDHDTAGSSEHATGNFLLSVHTHSQNPSRDEGLSLADNNGCEIGRNDVARIDPMLPRLSVVVDGTLPFMPIRGNERDDTRFDETATGKLHGGIYTHSRQDLSPTEFVGGNGGPGGLLQETTEAFEEIGNHAERLEVGPSDDVIGQVQSGFHPHSGQDPPRTESVDRLRGGDGLSFSPVVDNNGSEAGGNYDHSSGQRQGPAEILTGIRDGVTLPFTPLHTNERRNNGPNGRDVAGKPQSRLSQRGDTGLNDYDRKPQNNITLMFTDANETEIVISLPVDDCRSWLTFCHQLLKYVVQLPLYIQASQFVVRIEDDPKKELLFEEKWEAWVSSVDARVQPRIALCIIQGTCCDNPTETANGFCNCGMQFLNEEPSHLTQSLQSLGLGSLEAPATAASRIDPPIPNSPSILHAAMPPADSPANLRGFVPSTHNSVVRRRRAPVPAEEDRQSEPPRHNPSLEPVDHHSTRPASIPALINRMKGSWNAIKMFMIAPQFIHDEGSSWNVKRFESRLVAYQTWVVGVNGILIAVPGAFLALSSVASSPVPQGFMILGTIFAFFGLVYTIQLDFYIGDFKEEFLEWFLDCLDSMVGSRTSWNTSIMMDLPITWMAWAILCLFLSLASFGIQYFIHGIHSSSPVLITDTDSVPNTVNTAAPNSASPGIRYSLSQLGIFAFAIAWSLVYVVLIYSEMRKFRLWHWGQIGMVPMRAE